VAILCREAPSAFIVHVAGAGGTDGGRTATGMKRKEGWLVGQRKNSEQNKTS
jgi:hypothetical protein